MKKFYVCKHCGNIATKIVDMNTPLSCCGEKMEELIPKTADAATEKHVPVVEVKGNIVTVTVGSTLHPMTEEHHIVFILIETDKGFQRKDLDSTGAPSAQFVLLEGEKPVAVYEYCNKHGLWMNEL